MIVEFLLNVVWVLIKPLLDLLPAITIDIGSDTIGVFVGAVKAACYLLPMKDILVMISIVIAITVFRIIISLIKTIWEMLPIV